MRKLTAIAIALLSTAPTYAQTRDVTDSGVYSADRSGRYVRLEGRDGIVVEYLYAAPDATETSGLAVRVHEKLALTLTYAGPGQVAVAGLPKLTSVFDSQGRARTVLADGVPLAQLEYSADEFFSGISLPGRLTWTCSAPDPSHRVRQIVENARGQVVATAVVTTNGTVDGIRHGAAYEVVAEELGVDLDILTFERSPTGALTTARDERGRVAFYVVHADGADAGFSRDGRAIFYDVTLSVLGGEIAPGSDIVTSKVWEGQRGTIADHLLLTARGAVGLYAEESANGAIDSAWADAKGRLHSTVRRAAGSWRS
ncbi:MAG TPA: hypothetical protein VGD79_06480 [Thermoanaerobaculia bacterium]|jgi:hypothetical protein